MFFGRHVEGFRYRGETKLTRNDAVAGELELSEYVATMPMTMPTDTYYGEREENERHVSTMAFIGRRREKNLLMPKNLPKRKADAMRADFHGDLPCDFEASSSTRHV